jgi:hypothetical protein
MPELSPLPPQRLRHLSVLEQSVRCLGAPCFASTPLPPCQYLRKRPGQYPLRLSPNVRIPGECTIAFTQRVDVGALGTGSEGPVEFTYREPSARSRIACTQRVTHGTGLPRAAAAEIPAAGSATTGSTYQLRNPSVSHSSCSWVRAPHGTATIPSPTCATPRPATSATASDSG